MLKRKMLDFYVLMTVMAKGDLRRGLGFTPPVRIFRVPPPPLKTFEDLRQNLNEYYSKWRK